MPFCSAAPRDVWPLGLLPVLFAMRLRGLRQALAMRLCQRQFSWMMQCMTCPRPCAVGSRGKSSLLCSPPEWVRWLCDRPFRLMISPPWQAGCPDCPTPPPPCMPSPARYSPIPLPLPYDFRFFPSLPPTPTSLSMPSHRRLASSSLAPDDFLPGLPATPPPAYSPLPHRRFVLALPRTWCGYLSETLVSWLLIVTFVSHASYTRCDSVSWYVGAGTLWPGT